MRILFTATLFLGSALLFLIQPMIAKMILPRFGGSPGVWNTSMVFFQAVLLLGYGYAHLATKALGPRVQAATHILVLLLPLLALPITLPAGIQTGTDNPAPLVLLILAISVGAPFFVVSAGAPLLQRWFAATDDPHARDPYFLYSASNLGSMLALLAYPFAVEPTLRLPDQARLWTYGYMLLILLMAACAVAIWRRPAAAVQVHEAPANLPPLDSEEAEMAQPARFERLRWIMLAFCPSSLMLGVTTYLTSNIAPVPLLWVLPLALYLLTFIVAFAKKPIISSARISRFLPILIVPLAFTMVLEASEPEIMIPLVIVHLLVFFAVALLCHSELALSRPRSERLTEFYFYVSVGGVLGGAFNALLAPFLFASFFEYPLVLALACFFRPSPDKKVLRWDWMYPVVLAAGMIALILVTRKIMPQPTNVRSALMIGVPLIAAFLAADRPIRFASSLLVFFGVSAALQVAVQNWIIEAKRDFFGVHRIDSFKNEFGTFHVLTHGNTVHGEENFGAFAGKPLTYYHESGPAGELMRVLGPRFRSEALVGLGVGSLAYYGQRGQQITYYEIDPSVVELARDTRWFTFLARCKADLKIELGDARLKLQAAPPSSYDLILLDAFSSDSIPMHLLTEEALAMYLSKLRPRGVIAFHISNRYLDLEPVLGNEFAHAGLMGWSNEDDADDFAKGKFHSKWVIAARQQQDVQPLLDAVKGNWNPVAPDGSAPAWTDNYSNIVSVLKMFRPKSD